MALPHVHEIVDLGAEAEDAGLDGRERLLQVVVAGDEVVVAEEEEGAAHVAVDEDLGGGRAGHVAPDLLQREQERLVGDDVELGDHARHVDEREEVGRVVHVGHAFVPATNENCYKYCMRKWLFFREIR